MVDSEGIEFRLLGPLEVRDNGRVLPLGSPKQRALLALLVLHANEPVSRDRLIDELWGDAAPATVNSAFHVYLSRLRKLLGDHLVRDADGYRLRVDPDQLDVRRFDRLAVEGREALAAGDPERAAELLRDALALWRGAPLTGISEPFAGTAVGQLEESRLAALEDRIEADLDLGRDRRLVAELEALVAEQPYRERLRAHLMLALYRSGRQADALNAYRQARQRLGDDLGLEPSPELRRLEQAILRQEPELSAPPAADEREAAAAGKAPRSRRWWIAVAATVLVAGTAAVVAAIVTSEGARAPVVPPNSLAVVDPGSNRVADWTSVGVGPSQVTAGAGSIWVINVEDATLSRIDPATHRLQRTIPLPATPTGLAFGAGAVWVANGPARSLSRVDPALERVVDTWTRSTVHGPAGAVAVGAGWVWAVFADSTLRRIDPRSGRVRGSAIVGTAPAAVAVGGDAVWVANASDNTVSRVLVETTSWDKDFTPGRHPVALAVGAGALWVADYGDDAVTRIDLGSGSPTTIPVGRGPAGIAFGAGAVWVANALDGTVSRIDPKERRVVATIRVGNRPSGVAVAGGRVWVSVQAST